MTRLTNVVARPKVNRYPSGRPRNFTLAIEVAVEREYQTRGEVKGRREGGGKGRKREKGKEARCGRPGDRLVFVSRQRDEIRACERGLKKKTIRRQLTSARWRRSERVHRSCSNANGSYPRIKHA